MEITTAVSLRLRPLPILALGGLWLLGPAVRAQSFSADVAPVFAQKCVSCHGAGQTMAALNLTAADGLSKGGQNGPAVTPGNPEASRLYPRISGLEQPAMPLGAKLSDAEVASVKRWIQDGAKWEGGTIAAVKKPAAKENPRSWWAFQRPLRSPLPAVKEDRWRHNPVDAFVR